MNLIKVKYYHYEIRKGLRESLSWLTMPRMIRKKVVYLSSGWFHPSLWARVRLGLFLSRVEGIELVRGRFPRDLDLLKEARAAVLYYHKKKLPPRVVETLTEFARSKGLLGIHSVTASAKGDTDYASLWGGAFCGHLKPGPLRIIPVVPGDSPESSLEETGEIYDELYRHDFTNDPRTDLFMGEQAGVSVPLVWRKSFPGGGRLCYVGWGHFAASFSREICLRIMTACLGWLLSEEEE